MNVDEDGVPMIARTLTVMAAAVDSDGQGYSVLELLGRADAGPVELVHLVPELQEFGLMESIRENGRGRYRLTDEGLRVLRAEIDKITKLLEVAGV